MNINKLTVERYGRFMLRWKASCYIGRIYYVDFGLTPSSSIRHLFGRIGDGIARKYETRRVAEHFQFDDNE